MGRPAKLPRDIDALFDHMTGNLGHKPKEPREWIFLLRGTYEKLESLAPTLTKYQTHIDKSPEDYRSRRVNGRMVLQRVKTRPQLLCSTIAALSPRQVKAHAAKFRALGRKHKLQWEGVLSLEPMNWDEIFTWLNLPDARWRLRHHTDSGTPLDEPMPFTFDIELGKVKRTKTGPGGRAGARLDAVLAGPLGAALKDARTRLTGNSLLAQFPGRNNERVLAARYRKVEKAAAAAGAELLGVQFLEIDDFE